MGFLNLGKKKSLPRDIPPLPPMNELKRPNFEDLPPLPKLDLSDLPPLPKLNKDRTFELPKAKPKMEEFGREIGPMFPDIPEEPTAPSELPAWPSENKL